MFKQADKDVNLYSPNAMMNRLVAASVALFAYAFASCGLAQEAEFLGVVTNPTLAMEKSLSKEELAQYLAEQLDKLLHEDFRARQAANAALVRHPDETLDVISTVDILSGSRKVLACVELASQFATHVEYRISDRARRLLSDYAKLPTYAGRRAAQTLKSISDLAEVYAMQSIVLHGGIVDNRTNQIRPGGGFAATGDIRLKLDESFDKASEPISRIPSLKSTITLVLEDIEVEMPLAASLAELKNVRTVVFWRVKISPEALSFLRELPRLLDVQFNYVNIDDRSLDLLATIPVSKGMRLYGTDISPEAAKELAERLDNVEIYHGAGGFLGVATSQTDTIVSEVIPKSGAWKAGIQTGDRLKSINGVKIENFPDLRRELGKHGIGKEIIVTLERPVIDQESRELTFNVTLGQQVPEDE